MTLGTPQKPDPIALDYATAAEIAAPSDKLRQVSVRCSAVAGGGGVAILVSYGVTGWDWILIAGVLWLFVGAILTFVAYVCGGTYALLAMARKFPAPSSPGRAALAVCLPILTVAVAVACLFFGAMLVRFHEPSTFAD